jgi:hypothetical protein
MANVIDPTADEIERVAEALYNVLPDRDIRGGWQNAKKGIRAVYLLQARAAILAVDRRAEVACDVVTVHTSSGLPDYFTRVTVGDRSLDFFMSKIRGQADYHAAEIAWLLNGGEEPDILAFDYSEAEGLADYLATRQASPSATTLLNEGIDQAALLVEGRSTAVNSALIRNVAYRSPTEAATIIAEHDFRLGAAIRALKGTSDE